MLASIWRDFRFATKARRCKAVDTSGHQGAPDWHAVKRAGYVLAVLKASEGATVTDKSFHRSYDEARGAGLFVQAYHFARADLGKARGSNLRAWAQEDAGDEAAQFLKALAGRKMSRVEFAGGAHADVWLDWEKIGTNLPLDVGAEWVLTWVRLVEAAGYAVGIYSGVNTWSRTVGPQQTARKRFDGTLRPWWVPSYSDTKDPDIRVPEAFRPWSMWQHTDKGSVPGIRGDVDLNQFVGVLRD